MSGSGWEVVADGLAFPEAPRWHDGALWFSDIFGREVCTVGVDGAVRPVVAVPARPSGLGWRADGTLLVVAMADRRVLAVSTGGTSVVADLAGLVGGDCNDMLVDPQGRAYVGNFGYDYAAGEPRRPTRLLLVEPSGAVRPVADDLWFPNGMALAPGGGTLYVAETPAQRVSVYDVADDGSLSGRRFFGAPTGLGALRPDGIALDAEGALWVPSPGTGELVRLGRDGTVLTGDPAPGGLVQACALGGPDGRTLFACSTPTHDEAEALDRRPGRILATRVDVPAAGAG